MLVDNYKEPIFYENRRMWLFKCSFQGLKDGHWE
jgi:hypothetical protein